MAKSGLPKKYAKMGFKKGWAAYKRSKKSTSTTKSKRRTMAKKKVTRRRSKTTSLFGVNLSKAGAAAIYGALRSRTSNYLSPYTSKIPLGNISDEVGMFAAAHFAKKLIFKKASVIRDALTIGQSIEMARVGEAVINGQVGLGMNSGNAAPSSGNIF